MKTYTYDFVNHSIFRDGSEIAKFNNNITTKEALSFCESIIKYQNEIIELQRDLEEVYKELDEIKSAS